MKKIVRILFLCFDLVKLRNELAKNHKVRSIAHLQGYPDWISTLVWIFLLPYNPGNLGNWSIKTKGKLVRKTGWYEKEVLSIMLSLYKSRKDEFEGYFTSGATEGNIYSAWLGRNYLIDKEKKSLEEICLLRTSLTHYSIRKAASLIGVKDFIVSIDDNWIIDVKDLKNTIKKLYDHGYTAFLIPLTHGYTLTGTSDNEQKIVELIAEIERELPIKFFCWIDAALSGLVRPFTDETYKPLHSPYIQTYIVDLHKFGGVQIPAGIVLYQKSLRKLIETSIDYLEEKDSTLLGSRTGISPVASWFVLKKQGLIGFKKKVNICLKHKLESVAYLKQTYDIKLVNAKNSLSIAILPNSNKVKKDLEKKYDFCFKRLKIKKNGKNIHIVAAKAYFLT